MRKQRMLSALSPKFVIFVLLFSFFSNAEDKATDRMIENKPQAINHENIQAVKGHFFQEKNIKPLKRPFKSSGSFVYYPNKGLLWHTQKPVESIKLFANEGVYKVGNDGVLKKEAQLDNDFFLALFAGDEQKLAKFFTTEIALDKDDNTEANQVEANQVEISEVAVSRVEGEHAETKKAPCLTLIPISDTIKSLFKKVNLCMSELTPDKKIPNQISLFEAKGNQTLIQLKISSEKVSLEELAYFE